MRLASVRRALRRLGPIERHTAEHEHIIQALDDLRTELFSIRAEQLDDPGSFDALLLGFEQRLSAVTTRLLALEDRLAGGDVPASPVAVGEGSIPFEEERYAEFVSRQRAEAGMDAARFGTYAAWLSDASPVLELAGGPSEFGAQLTNAGLEARGDPAADPALMLAATPAGQLGAVASIGLAHQLSVAGLRRFLRLARRALRPGGLLLIETLDPSSHDAAVWLSRDPFGARLYHAAVLELLLGDAGFTVTKQEPVAGAAPTFVMLGQRV